MDDFYCQILTQKLVYGEQRQRKVFDVPDDDGKDLIWKVGLFFLDHQKKKLKRMKKLG